MNTGMIWDELPETITVLGEAFPIRTDFRVWIAFDILMTESALPPEEKVITAFGLIFREKKLPSSLREGFGALVAFYCGAESEGEHRKTAPKKRHFSFSQDAKDIYSAFYAQYHLDLSKEHLHWHRFCALLSGLSKDHVFCRKVAVRAKPLSDVKNAESRKVLAAQKVLYALPEFRRAEQIEADTAEAIDSVL